MMRKHTSLDALFSGSVQKILSTLLLERDDPWYLTDLAKRLGCAPSTLQRPLDSLVCAGIIRRWTSGNRVYFGVDPDCPFRHELRGLFAKTVGLRDVLRDVFRAHARQLSVAFVYGSMAKGEAHSQSDVDLLVVGSSTLKDLSPALANAEARLGRPISATVLPPDEFSARVAKKNHFLCAVLAEEKIFVMGTAHDLEGLAKSKSHRAARNQQGRSR
jgi:uncharacterized protein